MERAKEKSDCIRDFADTGRERRESCWECVLFLGLICRQFTAGFLFGEAASECYSPHIQCPNDSITSFKAIPCGDVLIYPSMYGMDRSVRLGKRIDAEENSSFLRVYLLYINVQKLAEDVSSWVCVRDRFRVAFAYILVVSIFWNINHHIHTTCAEFKRNCKTGENCRENPMAVEIQPFSVSSHTLLLRIYAQDSLTVSDRNGRTAKEMEHGRAKVWPKVCCSDRLIIILASQQAYH